VLRQSLDPLVHALALPGAPWAKRARSGERAAASANESLAVGQLGNIALQGGRVTLDPLRYDAKPNGITVDAAGRPWFAEADPGNPGWRIATPRGSDCDEYLVQPCAPASPCSGSYTGTGITDVAVAHDGSIWFTHQLRDEVGRLDVVNRTLTTYSLAGIDARLVGGQARSSRRRKPRAVILGTKTITLHGGRRPRVTIELNATGKRLLRRAGRLTVFFTVTRRGAPGKPPRRIKAMKVTFKVSRRRR
jgi:hypothetical protein